MKIIPENHSVEWIERTIMLRQEIAQIFIDAAHWNECVRKPDEQPIDPDPDGELRRIAAGYDFAIKRHIS